MLLESVHHHHPNVLPKGPNIIPLDDPVSERLKQQV